MSFCNIPSFNFTFAFPFPLPGLPALPTLQIPPLFEMPACPLD